MEHVLNSNVVSLGVHFVNVIHSRIQESLKVSHIYVDYLAVRSSTEPAPTMSNTLATIFQI